MRLVFPILLLAVGACGGSTTTDLFTDASANDSGGSNDSASGLDANGSDAGGPDARPDAAPPNCKDLLGAVANAQEKATKCNPGDPNTCGNIVAGMCARSS
jgi:hypothetical protein